MASKKSPSWYSVTLNLARITEVVPAEHAVVAAALDALAGSETSVGYTAAPVVKYGWDR